MADKKISALTAATTPLAGTEVLPIVQSGVTKQVSVADLTAGRAVSASTFTSTVATGTAPFTVTSTTEVANLTAASATTASNLKSNATTGVMQIAGPGAGTTRVMTIPNANFTAARTDAAQTFTGTQTFATDMIVGSPSGGFSALVSLAETSANTQYSFLLLQNRATETATTGASIDFGGAVNWLGRVSTQFTGSTGGGDTSMSFHTASSGVLTERVVIDYAGNTTIKAGNLVQGTAAKGINFTANSAAAGMTSQLLNWYEQGTFTPTYYGSTTTGTTTYTVQSGTYTRIGNVLYYNIRLAWSGATGTGNGTIGGFPYSAQNAYHTAAVLPSDYTLTALNIMSARIGFGNTMDLFQTPVGGGTQTAVGMDTAAELTITGHYFI